MGTVFQVPWAYLPEGWTEFLHTLGFRTAAMALRDDSVRLDDPRLAAERKLAVVMGTEGDGLADATIAACDYTVRIPMHHGVDSLNVAAAVPWLSISWENPRNNAVDKHKQPWYPEITNRTKGGGTHGKEA